MQPQSPVQYDFIVNPVKPPKRSFVSALTDGNPIVSIVIVIAVVIVALIFFIIINSFLNKNTNIPKLTVVAQQQNELIRSEEHTSELQSRQYLVCRLLLEKKKK